MSIKEEMINLAQLTNLDPSLVEEYIREAEHQDGTDYWENYFATGAEAFLDLDRYVANREVCDEVPD